MPKHETFYPKQENLGRECEYWGADCQCHYPKTELEGRRSCEGIIDTICVGIIRSKRPENMTQEMWNKIRQRIPDPTGDRSYIPPGDIS